MEPIRPGAAGPQVADVQRRLLALGFGSDDEPGRYGDGTVAAVRAFQRARGLSSNGIVGEETWNAIVEAGYTLGDRLLYEASPLLAGDDVRELQRRLNHLGFNAGQVDGMFGHDTAAAVREFQLNIGLQTDGIVGAGTIEALRRLHRAHQSSAVSSARERESLRRQRRRSLTGARILVDPQHGPDVPGVTGVAGTVEHEITWAIARRVSGRLGALGAVPILSRGPATSPSPTRRATLANEEQVDAIVSVACNGLEQSQACGVASYYFGQPAYESEHGKVLANLLHDGILDVTGGADCRVHPSTATILRASRAPAAIVEVGFLTHPEEGVRLADPGQQRGIAEAIVKAVAAYLTGAHREAVAAA